ncbi:MULTISPECIES: ATP-binding protein [unclassified Streptomyces]|uniref:ATP-binding protein n=1 Tax=unclassified Streptomyces TaxID=2593676 RepID=UPI001371A7D6|nr:MULTISPECIES: ATP-binding protein [unclassified Streptomyces]MYT68325.1 hypothetical protein [Streptomyces sp. SID8367]
MSVGNLAAVGQQRRNGPQQVSTTPASLPPAEPSKIAAAGAREAHVVPRLRRIGAAWLRHMCRMPEERVEDVLIVLSELLTNAVLHGKGHSVSYLSWSPRPGWIRFEISDETEASDPQPQDPAPMAESGRGLLLVSMFVKEMGGEWGYSNHGATAWCCLPIDDDQPVSWRRAL